MFIVRQRSFNTVWIDKLNEEEMDGQASRSCHKGIETLHREGYKDAMCLPVDDK